LKANPSGHRRPPFEEERRRDGEAEERHGHSGEPEERHSVEAEERRHSGEGEERRRSGEAEGHRSADHHVEENGYAVADQHRGCGGHCMTFDRGRRAKGRDFQALTMDADHRNRHASVVAGHSSGHARGNGHRGRRNADRRT